MSDSSQPLSSVYGNESYINQLLAKAVAAKASDIHLKVGIPPAARVRGDLVFFRTEALKPEDTENIARVVIKDPKIRAEIATLREHDSAYSAAGVSTSFATGAVSTPRRTWSSSMLSNSARKLPSPKP